MQLEQSGDFINSSDMPAWINANEVMNNFGKYYLIDIRSSQDFLNGHIEGSINILPANLINHLKSINSNEYEKIVLISSTGEESAYCTGLLRFLNYDNVYSLKWGIAVWNIDFADIWFDNQDERRYYYHMQDFRGWQISKFDDVFPIDKDGYFSLPFNNNTNLESRIQELLSEGFSNASFTFDEMMSDYVPDPEPNPWYNHPYKFNHTFVICYGPEIFYWAPVDGYIALGHPFTAVRFRPYQSLKPLTDLQVIPPSKIVGVYCITGQENPFVVAYLRILGYNAKSVRFGGQAIYYKNLHYYPWFESLEPDSVKNFNYVTGP